MSRKIVVAIVPQDKEREVAGLLTRSLRSPTVISARGMASVLNVGNLFGFSDDKRVAVVSSCTPEEADEYMNQFENEMNFNKPNTGIAFVVNVDGFIGYPMTLESEVKNG